MAPQVLHPRMASILFFLTTSFALPPAMQVLAQEQAETTEKSNRRTTSIQRPAVAMNEARESSGRRTGSSRTPCVR